MARFGFSDTEWTEMRDEMRRVLSEVACHRETITYGELVTRVSGARMSPRSAALAELLGEVCEVEDAERGTMLGSVVVRADSGKPGDGYFRHAAGLGRDVSDAEGFWRGEVTRVWDVWQDECDGGARDVKAPASDRGGAA
jgi:hypothetical protein